jgi:hypothetical protein
LLSVRQFEQQQNQCMVFLKDNHSTIIQHSLHPMVGSLERNTALEYSTRVVRRETVDVKRVLLTI